MSARVILLCEDARTDTFVRRFLWSRNLRGRDIHTVPIPTGDGSGEQRVREQYPKELQDIRDREGRVLLVVTDADVNTTAVRRSQLDRQCDTKKISRTTSKDRVIVAIPRRNIETWLWHLETGDAVDETRDYKPRFRAPDAREIHNLADELFRMCHRMQRLLPTAPPSLSEACREYPNLTRFLR
jgi:hypothetical protein